MRNANVSKLHVISNARDFTQLISWIDYITDFKGFDECFISTPARLNSNCACTCNSY